MSTRLLAKSSEGEGSSGAFAFVSLGHLHSAGGSGQIGQLGFAFVAGTALYVVRMAQGALLPAMALHALWDFGTLGASASNTTTPLFVGLVFQLTLIVSLVAAWQVIRAKKDSSETSEAIPA